MMTAMASSGAAQTCRGCQESVVFVTEAFGSVCTNCGTMVEEEDFRYNGDVTSETVKNPYKGLQYHQGRVQQEATKMNQARQLKGLRRNRPEIDAVARAILLHFGSSNLLREVQDLAFQVFTIHQDQLKKKSRYNPEHISHDHMSSHSDLDHTNVDLNRQQRQQQRPTDEDIAMTGKKIMLRGEQAICRLAVAATFSTLKKSGVAVTLQDVCSVANIAPLEQIADVLQYMERILGGTVLLDKSRENPSAHFAGIVSFLVKQTSLKPRCREVSPIVTQDDESVLEVEEQRFVKKAKIESPDFTKLAFGLCDLCSFHGFNNRSSKTTSRKDLALCAWAVLLLAMEASSGQVCNQGKMARAASRLKAMQVRDSKDESIQVQLTATARTAAEEVVKKRYVEISRMLTLYLEQLPWLSNEKPVAKVKKASKSKGRGKVAETKQHLTSIKPFPRKIIAKYLGDVIKLRRYIEFRLSKADIKWNSMDWSRFSSTEEQFHRIRQTVDGQRLIKEEELQYQSQQRNNAVAWSSQDGILAAIDDLLEGEGQGHLYNEDSQSSRLATSVGSTLLQLDVLEAMADEVVDSLLFEKGEMESYIRSSEEVQLVQSLRADKGEWDPETTAVGRKKRSRSEEEEEQPIEKLNIVGGKRTKALTEAEAARILSLL